MAEFGKVFGEWAAHPHPILLGIPPTPCVPQEHHMVLSTFASHFPSVHGPGDIWSSPGCFFFWCLETSMPR